MIASRLARIALAAAVAGQLALVWHVRVLPTQDGPIHVYNAALLVLLADPAAAAASPTLAATFEERPTLANRVPQQVFGAVVRMFGARAEPLFVSAYLILFALGGWWCVTGVRGDHGSLAVLVALLALNYPLHMGFYPFNASLPLALATIGLWARPGHRRPLSLVLQALALVAANLCHPFAFVFAGVACGCLTVLRALASGGTLAGRARALAGELALLAATALPAAILFGRFVGGGGDGLAYLLPGPGRVLAQLTTEPDWVAFSRLEWAPVALGLGLPLAITAWAAVGRWRAGTIDRADAFALAALVVGAAYLGLPDAMSGGAFVHARLSLTAAIAAALWAATAPRTSVQRDWLAIGGASAALALVAVLLPAYRTVDDLLGEYARALAVVPAHARLLPISTADLGTGPDPHAFVRRPRPFLHAAGRVDLGRDIALLENYQASRPQFPIQYRPGANPYDQNPLTLFPYGGRDTLVAETGPADYVLTWGPIDPAGFAGLDLSGVLAPIVRDYEPIYVSPRGLARVWRHARDTPRQQP